MNGETGITLVGNLVADPEVRYTKSGVAVTQFRVASTPRKWDSDAQKFVDSDESLFLACNWWREPGENFAASVGKGDRVVVTGVLTQRSYEQDGKRRFVFEVVVDEAAVSTRFARVAVTRVGKGVQESPSSSWVE